MREDNVHDVGGEIDHVIEAIDGALADYSVSGDAMRWSPEPDPAEEPPGSPLRPTLASVMDGSWLAGIRVVLDESIPPGMALLVADHAVRDARMPPRVGGEEREQMLRLIAATYEVPLCLVDGHRWGPEEVRVGVDGGPEGASVIHAYWAECSRCGERRFELRPGWVQQLRRR